MQSFLESWGYVAIIVFGVLQAACIPISSELTFLLGGALASSGMSATHHLNLALVIVVGTLAEIVGSYLSYAVGRKGGRPLVHRYGRYVLVTQNDVDRAERFLVGRGAWAIPVARMLPFIRAFTSIVCGLVEIPALRFGILNLIGTVVYVTALSYAGYALGSEWNKVNKTFSDVSYVVVAVVVIGLAFIVFHRVREFRKESAYAAKHGGTTQVGSSRERQGRLYRHRAGGGGARGHRHPGGHKRDLMAARAVMFATGRGQRARRRPGRAGRAPRSCGGRPALPGRRRQPPRRRLLPGHRQRSGPSRPS